MTDGLVQSTQRLQGRPQIVVRVRILRLDDKRLAIVVNGFVEVAFRLERIARLLTP